MGILSWIVVGGLAGLLVLHPDLISEAWTGSILPAS